MTERGFNTGFWTSPFAIDLPKEAKLLHAYCRTNQHCNQAGLYPIAVKTISFETGIPAESIPELFDLLKPEIVWYPEANLVWVRHFLKEQAKSSKFVVAALSCLSKDSLPEDIVAEFQMYNQKIFIEANVHPQLSLTRRECVIIRDNFRCQYCGKELKEVADYEMDHIMPRISGGKDNYQNLVASCVKCARLKANRSPKDVGLHIPQAMPFHSTQALFLLKTDNKIRERWLSLFPERQRSAESMLSNVGPGYTIDTISRININPGYTTNSNANASASANANANAANSLFWDDLFSLSDLQKFVSETPSGIDRLAQHEAIKQKLADLGKTKGFVVRSEYQVSSGRVDLCWLTQRGEVVAGFEIDYRTPRDKSLEKLRDLRCPRAWVLVRKQQGLQFVPVEQANEEAIPCSRTEVEETLCKGDRSKTIPPSESEIEESLSAGDGEVISIWRSVEGFNLSEADAATLVARLRTEFPDIDILGESKAWAARKISEPITRRSRPSGQLWNWMKLARDFAQQRREGKLSGQRNRLPSTGPGSGRGRLPTDAEREDSVGGPLR